MSFPRYPSYKDSGIEWLGQVPEHWGSAKLRWLSKSYSGGTPDKLNLSYWTGGTIPWLNSGAVNETIINEPSAFITEEAFQKSSAKWIPMGALVMALAGQGKTKGMVAQLGFQTTCNQSMAAIIPTKEIEARFLYWWLAMNYQNIRNMAGGDLRDGLNLEMLGDIPCPLVPIKEQNTIYVFLDRETARIDTLIAKKNRFIELLKEKRQALITHAVTKGLDPDVKMKDSGTDWLGEVPEHWEVVRLASLGKLGKANGGSKQDDEDYGIPCVRYGDLYTTYDYVIDDVKKFISPEKSSDYTEIKYGDLLFAASGETFEEIGKSAINLSRLHICCGGDLIVLKPSREIAPLYLAYAASSTSAQAQKSLMGKGFTVIHIYADQIRDVVIAVPPTVEEQQKISETIQREIAIIDTLNSKTQHSITLLKERRSALITAAVTGQIDLREPS